MTNLFANVPSQQPQNAEEEETFTVGAGDANLFADAPSQQVPSAAEVLEQVSYQDPDRAATVFDAANVSSIPVGLVEPNLEEVQRQQRVKDANPDEFGPTLNSMMGIPENAVLMQDDLENLKRTEELLAAQPRALGKARNVLHSMILDLGTAGAGTLQEFFENQAAGQDRVSPVAEFFREVALSGKRESEELMPQFENEMVGSAVGGVKSAANFITLMGLTKGAALGPMVAQQMGLSYVDAREKGLDVGDASLYAKLQGAIEGGTEVIPFSRLVKTFGKGKFLKTMGEQLVIENLGEQMATAGQDLVDHFMLPENADKTLTDYFKERPNAALQTLIATTVGTSVQTGVVKAFDRVMTKPVDKAAGAEAVRIIASEQGQKDLDKIITLAQETKVGPRQGDTYEKFLEGAGSEQSVYIPSDILANLEDVDIPQVFLDQIDGLGADIEIPMEMFMTEITANDDLMAALRPHIRMGEDLMSATDIEQGGDMTTRRLIERAQVAADAAQEISDISDTITEQLVGTGRLSRADATKSAALWTSRINTMVVDHGMTPKEAQAYINTRIVDGDAPGLGDATVMEQESRVLSLADKLGQKKESDLVKKAQLLVESKILEGMQADLDVKGMRGADSIETYINTYVEPLMAPYRADLDARNVSDGEFRSEIMAELAEELGSMDKALKLVDVAAKMTDPMETQPALRQLDKRRDMVEKLRKCMMSTG